MPRKITLLIQRLLVFWDRPVGNIYRGENAEEYLSRRVSQPHWRLEQESLEEILRRLPDGGRVLDVPFGTGRFVNLYLQKHMAVFGLDASADMLQIARTQLKEDFSKCDVRIGDAARLPYPSEYFDIVVCVRFLSHVLSYNKAKRTIKELARVTRKYAILQFRVRHDSCPPVRSPLPWEPMNDRLYLREIETILHRSGLCVVEVKPLDQRPTYYRALLVCTKIFSRG